MDWITTTTVLEGLRDFENQLAWERFVGRFRRPLLSYARRYLSDTDAEDVTQEILLAFAEAYRNDKYERTGRLSSWLFGIAYRQIVGCQRKVARQQQKHDARGDHTSFWRQLPGEIDAQHEWDTEWEKALVSSCIEQARRELNEPTFRAFDLVVRQGRSADEVAAELNMSRNAVYIAKHRVLKKLEELARGYEVQ